VSWHDRIPDGVGNVERSEDPFTGTYCSRSMGNLETLLRALAAR
jgi:hypothetical protein